jgi:hypothetical protein
MACWIWAATSSSFEGDPVTGFRIVAISELKGHEMPRKSRVEELRKDMEKRGVLIKPIVADRDTGVILDGHCRCDALRRLGRSKVAVRFVDYNSEKIEVERWGGGEMSKGEVIEAGLSGRLMMPKSSKHMIKKGIRRVHISEVCEDALVPLEKL